MSFMEILPAEINYNLFTFLSDRDLCAVGVLNKKYKQLTEGYLFNCRKDSSKIKMAWQEYLTACKEYKATCGKLESTTLKKNIVLNKLKKKKVTAFEEILLYANVHTCLSSCAHAFKTYIRLNKIKSLKDKQNKYAAKVAFIVAKKEQENKKSLALHREFCNCKRGEKQPVYSAIELHRDDFSSGMDDLYKDLVIEQYISRQKPFNRRPFLAFEGVPSKDV